VFGLGPNQTSDTGIQFDGWLLRGRESKGPVENKRSTAANLKPFLWAT